MAYDERLAERITGTFKGRKGVQEKCMFGGICSCSMATCAAESKQTGSWSVWRRIITTHCSRSYTLRRWISPANHSKDSCSSAKRGIARPPTWLPGLDEAI